MTFQKIFVYKKLEDLSGYLGEIKEFFKSSDKEIIIDSNKLHVAERLLQLIVDTMIDINQHFIKELGLKISDDLQGIFYVLGGNKILPKDFTKRIAPVVGLRKRIVHRYDSLDQKMFIKSFRNNYTDFEEYIKLINKYLEKIK